MKKWIIIGIILLVVILVSVYFYKKSKKSEVIVTQSGTGIQRLMQKGSPTLRNLKDDCLAGGGVWIDMGDVWGVVNGVAGWQKNYGCAEGKKGTGIYSST